MSSSSWSYDPDPRIVGDLEYRYREAPGGAVLEWYDDAGCEWFELGLFDSVEAALQEVSDRRMCRRLRSEEARAKPGSALAKARDARIVDADGKGLRVGFRVETRYGCVPVQSFSWVSGQGWMVRASQTSDPGHCAPYFRTVPGKEPDTWVCEQVRRERVGEPKRLGSSGRAPA